MEKIEINMLSKRYDVRRLDSNDVEMIYAFCKKNTQYYAYCGKEISTELIENDMAIAPPGIPMEQKFYIGFFEGSRLVAIMDLIDGYPDETCAYLGCFMMNKDLQGVGIGSRIIAEVLDYLKKQEFQKCMLAIDKANPQSNHFWRKNGFEVVREVVQETGALFVAEKLL